VIALPAAPSTTLPVTLPDLPDVADHAIAGRATVPAVWLLELLVETVAEHEGWPSSPPLPLAMSEVGFPRFLPAQDLPRCSFAIRMEPTEDGLRASLVSSIALSNGMKRAREHAQSTFGAAGQPPSPPPPSAYDYEVTSERIYRELITFGPRYCNVRGTVRLGREGCTGIVRSPAPPLAPPPLAGCPYLVDAAMHLACVWGQRYAGYVAYPTGFAARVLTRPTPWGERRCTVVPRAVAPRRLIYDLWLCDEGGAVCDTILGLAMAPLANSAPPPSWITLDQERA
jgi:hypothetical protein